MAIAKILSSAAIKAMLAYASGGPMSVVAKAMLAAESLAEISEV